MSMGELTDIFKKVREASRSLVTCGVENINQMLLMLADATETNTQQILAANADDLSRMDVNNPKYDRLESMPIQETLVFPLKQISSPINGFKGQIKNVIVKQE